MKPAVRFPVYDFTITHGNDHTAVEHHVTEGVGGPGLGWRSALPQAIRQSYRLLGAVQPHVVQVVGVTEVAGRPFHYMVRTSRDDVLVVRVRAAGPTLD